MLGYVWPAVGAFLRMGLGGDPITVPPNCRSVCMGVTGSGKKARWRIQSLLPLSPDSPRVNPEGLKVERRKGV